jgi:predicted CopG family antitoxin
MAVGLRALARAERRSFSNYIQVLIERDIEHKRRNFQVAAPARAENGGQE